MPNWRGEGIMICKKIVTIKLNLVRTMPHIFQESFMKFCSEVFEKKVQDV